MTKGVSGFTKNDESFIFCNFLASSSTLSSKSVFELLDSNDPVNSNDGKRTLLCLSFLGMFPFILFCFGVDSNDFI